MHSRRILILLLSALLILSLFAGCGAAPMDAESVYYGNDKAAPMESLQDSGVAGGTGEAAASNQNQNKQQKQTDKSYYDR